MAIFMSDERLAEAMRAMADRGELVQTGWQGFRAVCKAQGQTWTPEQEAMLRHAYWTGARCVFDVFQRLDKLGVLTGRQVRLLDEELGKDPFCRPPKPSTEH